MLREDEVVMLIMGIGVLFFILLNRGYLKKIESWKVLIWSYIIVLFGWLFTVLETFFLEKYLNLFEHLSYAISGILFTLWCWNFTHKAKQEELR
jgi:dolichyl-phosphate-mannose--protein O-mannosyl transferase